MFGKIDFNHVLDLRMGLIVGLCVLSAVTDLIWGRIFNWITFPAFLLGLIFATVQAGAWGLGEAVLAGAAGFLLYGWMFWIGMMGGGDVKLLMALGAWGGLRFVGEVALLGVLLGGAMALLILISRGRIRGFVQRMYRFLQSVFIKELQVEKPEIDQKLQMPFGVPIAAAAIWLVLGNPWAWLGWRWGA